MKDAKKAEKMHSIEQERAQDQAIYQAQILAYYRSRADVFDTDRSQLYAKLDAIRIKQDVVHKSEWELRKRLEEKRELETALERCQHVLYIERQKIMDMKKDSDTFKVKQRATKRQILDLLHKSNSVEQHIYYNDGQQPEKISHFAPMSMNTLAEQEGMSEFLKPSNAQHSVDCAGQEALPRVTVASSR